MPNLVQINESNLLPINNPNLLNPFATFDSDYTWNIVSGSGTAIQRTQSKKTGARGLQLKSLVTDGLTCGSALTEVTIAETGQHILSFKLREDAGGLNDNIMIVNIYVNGLLTEYELLLSGNTSDWKTYTQVIQLEIGDVITYGFTIATNDVGSFYVVSVDDFKLEIDTNGSGIPSVYTPSYDNGLYLVQVTDNVYSYSPYIKCEQTNSIDVGSISSNGSVIITTPLIGAEIGDFVQLSYPLELITLDLVVGLPIVSVTDEVKFIIHNHSGSSVNPSLGDYKLKITK